LIDQSVFYKEEYPLDYVNTYSRILSIVKDIEPKEFDNELRRMRSFEPPLESISFKRVQAQIFSNSFTMQLSYLISIKKYKVAYELIDDLNKGLKEYTKIVSPSTNITFRYIIAYLLFANGEYKQAKKAVNIVLNEFEEIVRPEIYNFARILNILIHYELKDFGIIKSLHNSAVYYFRKQNNPYKTENLFLNYFGNPKRYKSAIKTNLNELRSEFIGIKSEKSESNVFKYFEFIDWIDSKLQGVTMAKLQK
jgi:tetratricopeptide (TPR) repeat protein